MASLVQGGIYCVRYGTKTSSSTQQKGVRRIEVSEGPHTHERFRGGEPRCRGWYPTYETNVAARNRRVLPTRSLIDMG